MSEATIQFQGRLTRDPETRQTKNGNQMVTATVAVDGQRGAQGNQATAFYRVAVFGRRGDFVMQYFRKGSPIMVSGTLNPSLYEGQNGPRLNLDVNASQVDFTLREPRNQGGQNYQQAPQQNYQQQPQYQQQAPQGQYQQQQYQQPQYQQQPQGQQYQQQPQQPAQQAPQGPRQAQQYDRPVQQQPASQGAPQEPQQASKPGSEQVDQSNTEIDVDDLPF